MATAPIKAPRITRHSVKSWTKGTVTALDDGRTPTDGLASSSNAILDQDGTVRPRPSLMRYGTQFPGTLLGELTEFTKFSGATNQAYLLGMFNVSGTTKPYYSIDGGAWTILNGATYNNTATTRFVQADDKVLVMNRTNNLSYVDIPTFTVIPFTALTTPVISSVVATGLSGSVETYYYKVTANSTVGETAASASVSVVVGTARDLWTPASQYVTVTWGAVAGTNVTYNVYLSSISGQEMMIQSGINGTSFKDDGSTVANVGQLAPVGDSTAGPKVGHGSFINNQIFLYDDADFPRYIRFGGTNATELLNFSPFAAGAGTTELGRGTKEVPVSVKSFRDGRGVAQITALCRGTNGTGKRYLLTPSTTTYGTQVIGFMKVTEDNGQDGTDSPDGVVLYKDALWYPSRDGFKTTGTKPQLQNILSTDTVSETIINDVKNLNNAAMKGAVGLAYQGRIYWALPNGSTSNNEIWVLDLQRGGAWMKPWSIAASWMMLYNSNDGATHHIVVSNNILYELTDAQATYDDGVAFPTVLDSGILKFSDDSLEWANVIDVTFILLRPQGVLNFLVAGKTEDSGSVVGVGGTSFTSNSSVAGWGEAGWGGSPDAVSPRKPQIFGWSNFSVVPISFGDALTQVTIEVDEDLQWLTWSINSTQGGTFYQLSDVVIRSVDVGVKDLT